MSLVIKMASEVSNFLQEIDSKQYNKWHEAGYPEDGYALSGTPPPHDDMAYGEALVHWYAKSRVPARAYFSTDDKFMLHYTRELELRFGLEVITHEEAKLRKLRERTYTTPVCGDGTAVGLPILAGTVLTPSPAEKKKYGAN